MKNFIFFLLASAFLVACKKDNSTNNTASNVDAITLENAVVVSEGNLVFAGNTAESGTVRIYRQQNDKYVLALENMNYKTVFDLGVYLSTTQVYSSASLKLFSVKDFDEDVYYRIPAGIKAENYKFIIIKKLAAADPVATATLH